MKRFVFESRLAAPPDVVWHHATRPALLNREFSPLLRMTFPSGTEDLTSSVPVGERVCRSWILFLGLIPVEYDDLTFTEIEPGRRFLEQSTMLTQRLWKHERQLVAEDTGTLVRDRVTFDSRVPLLEPVQGLLFRAVFAWRHHRLRRLFRD